MEHLPFIATITAAFTAAWVLGLLAQALKLSPIVGYLLAGVVIGPYTPGFVGNADLAHELAEVGVILLMFGVGLHFHWQDLWAVRRIALPGALGQTAVATLSAAALLAAFGMSFREGAVLGLALAVASTVVLMRMLMAAGRMESAEGHIAVGWLLVEDLLTVLVLVLIPVFGVNRDPSQSVMAALGWSAAKLVALVVVVAYGGSRVIPWMLVQVARLRSRELFTLTVLVCSIAIAAGSYALFGASMALGAFLAGMVVAQSPLSHQVAADILPLRDAFCVLFFVAVGMLFDPSFLVERPGLFLAVLGLITVVKPLAALFIVRACGYSPRVAITVALGLGQIGEFSFILSEVAQSAGLMGKAGHHALVGAAIFSITLNSLVASRLDRIESWLRTRPGLWRWLGESPTPVAASATSPQPRPAPPDAIIVGYGPVGRAVDLLLREAGRRTLIIDLNADTVQELSQAGRSALFGDASNHHILAEARVAQASHLVVTLPDSGTNAAVIAAARHQNPHLRIHARGRYLSDRGALESVGANGAVLEEVEAAVALARTVLRDAVPDHRAEDREVDELRTRLLAVTPPPVSLI